MDNKVNFLRGTSTEYETVTKDNDTFYYTTDDEKLYLGNKEITGDSVTIDNTLSDTSKNPVQNKVINAALNSKADQTTVDNALAQKANSADVTALLAGKSDTGHTHDDRYYTESETNTLLGDKVGVSDFNSHTNNTTVHVTTAEKTAWNAKADLSDIPSSLPANGGDADTLDNLHASSFAQNLGAWSSGYIKDLMLATTKSGFITIAKTVTGMPVDGVFWYGFLDCNSVNRCLRVTSTGTTGLTYSISCSTSTSPVTWYDWHNVADGGNASTVNGLTVQTAVPANAEFTDTVYTHPTYTARTGTPTADQTPEFGETFNITQPISDSTGHITEMNSRTVKIPATTATSSSAGLMSSEDKSKLDGIADGATKVTVDSSLSTSSTNPVQNKIIAEALNTTAQNLGEWSSGYIKDLMVAATKSGFITIAKTVTGMPVDGVYWYGFLDCNNANRCLRVTSTGNAGLTYSISYIASSQTWFNWHNVADGGNAASVGGRTITVTDVDPGAGAALNTGEIVFVTEVT